VATYFDDFDYSSGDIVTVSGGNWSKQSASGWTYNVASSAWAVDDPAGYWGDAAQYIVNDEAGSTSGDIEVVARIKIGSVAGISILSPFGVALIDSNPYTYACCYQGSGNWRLYEFRSGSTWAQIGSQADAHYTPSDDTYFYIRIGRSGTTIRAQINTDGATGSWAISGTNTGVGTAKAGVYASDSSATPYTFDLFGIGTGGDTAPIAAGGAASATKRSLLLGIG
jgi:hypothetical protein